MGRGPVSAVMQTVVQLIPLRHSSADILVVYLLFCLHLCITKGTTVKPRLHPSGFRSPVVALQVFCGLLSPPSVIKCFVYDVPLGSITCHLWMPNTRDQTVWGWQTETKVLVVHLIISQGYYCSQALLKCTNQRGELYFRKAMEIEGMVWQKSSSHQNHFCRSALNLVWPSMVREGKGCDYLTFTLHLTRVKKHCFYVWYLENVATL